MSTGERDDEERAIRLLVESTLRIRAALAALDLADDLVDKLGRWMAYHTTGDEGAPPAVDLSLAATAPRARATLEARLGAAGPGTLLDYFTRRGADAGACRALEALLAAATPGAANGWIAAAGGKLDEGWATDDALPLAHAAALLGSHPRWDPLARWAADLGIERSARLSRSMGRGNPMTEVVLALPERDGLAPVARAFEALGAPLLPEGALEVLGLLEGSRPCLSAWLTARGVSKLGVRVANATAATLTELGVGLGVPQGDLDAIAAVEGALAVTGPRWLELQVQARGVGVEVEYAAVPPASRTD